jgi:hypothetical protein
MIDPEENHMVTGYGWRDREIDEWARKRAEELANMADDELDEIYAEEVTEEELERFELEMELANG